ncbi:hypothetical protein FisN_5Lu071 [Fistulifera solaris]|uniref:Uncharacterized protein n=1 Tax=Fistulifera solaris TaxID=1519565 RepID=A0A1Z5JJJ3_FISSO|nr:hypothetical protein FisN_5Lu071 [Fistulifera solaris]|eukprot:GAX14012.1 hypothetical protein FisN_5Lu071 [Fistulifera solaris]
MTTKRSRISGPVTEFLYDHQMVQTFWTCHRIPVSRTAGPEFLDLSQSSCMTTKWSRISGPVTEFLYDHQMVQKFWTYLGFSRVQKMWAGGL